MTIAPDDECVAHGAKYCCQINRGADDRSGTVLTEQGDVRCHYGIRANPSGRSLGNPLNKPDFVVTDGNGKAELIIRRESLFPSVFHILEANKHIGRIRTLSILRNKYMIEIEGENCWTFQMPLFTARFWGGSHTGAEMWVAVGPSMMEWNILIKPGVNDRHLLAALAFIHSEWWNFS
jgi:hypothetical protein